MKWILFYQTPNDRVCFITDESDDRTSLSYRKFCDNIFKYSIKSVDKFQLHLDTFRTVFLNVETGEWEKVDPERIDVKDIPFDVLVKLNPNPEDKEKQEQEKNGREVNLTKQYFDKKWEDAKKGLFSKHGQK